jgi:MipA family protein
MKHAVEAALRFPTSGTHRTLFAATLAALGATVTVFDRASAQTAFTLPAPPFELPLVPPVSGNWTVMIGAEGQYRPDFEGASHSLFIPVPIFSIRSRRLGGSVSQPA